MAQLAVDGPFDERDRDFYLWVYPVRPEPWQAARFREWRFRNFDRVEPLAQIDEEPAVDAGADLAGEGELSLVVMPDEQRAEADTRALRIGEAADDELVPQ